MSDNLKLILKGVVAAAGTTVTALLGGWDYPLIAMAAFVIGDYVVALLAALITGKFDSAVGYKGFVKKAGYFLAVAGAHIFDTYILKEPLTRTATALVFALNDAGSFFARLAVIGVPIPEFLLKALQTEIDRKRGNLATPPDRSGAA